MINFIVLEPVTLVLLNGRINFIIEGTFYELLLFSRFDITLEFNNC